MGLGNRDWGHGEKAYEMGLGRLVLRDEGWIGAGGLMGTKGRVGGYVGRCGRMGLR